jgi:chromosome segregation ATPase
VEGDAAQLLARVDELEQQKSSLHDRWRDLEQQRKDASAALDRLTDNARPRAPTTCSNSRGPCVRPASPITCWLT